MSDLIDTTEMYLRTIFELEEEGVQPLRARIAERLEQSGPTVSQTVARMERDGLLVLGEDRSLHLTDAGRTAAVRVMRKHRLAECMLVDIIGLPLESVHEEACRWEHVMSLEVEARLVEMLDRPQVSPFGNPIPGLEEIGLATEQSESWHGLDAHLQANEPEGAPGDSDQQVVVLRIGEQVQHQPELIAELARAGVRPGARIRVTRDLTGKVQLAVGDTQVQLPSWAAAQIAVAGVDPSDQAGE